MTEQVDRLTKLATELLDLSRLDAGQLEVQQEAVPLAEAAHRCGYADQAHLTREWVALAGCPPSTWLREEFPFLQDLHPEAGGE